MANIQERRDKNGKLTSFSIRVHRGRGPDGKQLKPWTATFEVRPSWTEERARKRAEAFASTFEKECREGTTSDTRLKFRDYCEYVLELKEKTGAKHSTIIRYRDLTRRIYPAIGHIKLKDLRVDHLNSLYLNLLEQGSAQGRTTATVKIDLAAALKAKGITRVALAEKAQLPVNVVYATVKSKPVRVEAAQVIAQVLGLSFEQSFTVHEEQRTLSPKTVIEHHRLISTVLEQASKEGLIPFNIAQKATLPKVKHKDVQYFQPSEVEAIRDALEQEPIKWRTITHLFLITGARRGEILGLKWKEIDWERNRLHICNNVLYAPDIGIYVDTPKTESSVRYITVPRETMDLLKRYRAWQNSERLRLGAYYHDQGFVFSQDNGGPMHPDSVTDWMRKFSKRHELPHIHPHSFRHTMASLLYASGADSVSISKRLGHAQVSTTANIYAHVMEDADQRNADILAGAILKKA